MSLKIDKNNNKKQYVWKKLTKKNLGWSKHWKQVIWLILIFQIYIIQYQLEEK